MRLTPVDLLATLTPDELWAAHERIDRLVALAVYPEVMVCAEEEDGYPDSLMLYLVCPRCGVCDEIVEVDSSDRWNQLDGVELDDPTVRNPSIMTVSVMSSESDFQTIAYMCQSCYLPVDMPEWVDTVWV